MSTRAANQPSAKQPNGTSSHQGFKVHRMLQISVGGRNRTRPNLGGPPLRSGTRLDIHRWRNAKTAIRKRAELIDHARAASLPALVWNVFLAGDDHLVSRLQLRPTRGGRYDSAKLPLKPRTSTRNPQQGRPRWHQNQSHRQFGVRAPWWGSAPTGATRLDRVMAYPLPSSATCYRRTRAN